MGSLDRNPIDKARARRNGQRTRNGDVTNSVKVNATGGLANPTSNSGLALKNPTTKGDLLGFDTAPNRVPVGANATVLTADSTQALGVKWGPAGGVVAFKGANVAIDFGATPTSSKVFSVADANVLTTHSVVISQSGAAPSGKSQDENEMDPLILRAVCTVNGTLTVYADADDGPVVGQYLINYLLS